MPLPISRSERQRAPSVNREHTSSPCNPSGAAAVLGGGSIREALLALGRAPRKAFGQHFLAQPAIAQRMAQLADVAGRRVVEVGPGLGVLSQFLLNADELWLLEIDRELAARLNGILGNRPSVHVWNIDALALDWGKFLQQNAPVRIVGNLPYNVATALLERWLEIPEHIDRIVVMVQREVAERLRARAGSRQYSALSVLTQAVAHVHKGFSVSPGAFVPPPRVQSQVVVVVPDPALRQRVADFDTFRKIVRTLFQQRRKQLHNGLAQLVSNPRAVLQLASLDARLRPEDLTVADFLRLAEALSSYARVA